MVLSLPTFGFAELKPAPLGSMVVLGVEDPHLTSEACWDDPNVQGVLLLDEWALVQASDGDNPNWDYFVNGVNFAQSKGKWVMLSVDCGLAGPSWYFPNRESKFGPLIWSPAKWSEIGPLLLKAT